MARPKQDLQRRERILTIAHELFGYYGFDKTTMDEIAEKAGLGKGSLYLEFSSKNAILQTIIEGFHQDMLCYMESVVENTEQSAVQRMGTMLLVQVAQVARRSQQLIHSPETLAFTSLTMKQELGHEFFQARNRFLATLIAQGKGEEAFPPELDEAEAAVIIYRGLGNCFPPYWPGESAEQVVNAARQLIPVLIAGLAQPPPPLDVSEDLLPPVFQRN